MREDTTLTSFTKERPSGRRSTKINNSVLNREVYIKELEQEQTKRNMSLDVAQYLQECAREKELDLLDARLEAAAREIQEHIIESEIDEKMQRLEARLEKAAWDIDKCIEEEEMDEERESKSAEMEARLLDAAAEIALRDMISKYWSRC